MILNNIRELMEKEGLDLYLVPTFDPHGSEYLPNHYNERQFVSGFTGSAGTALITKDAALLWADGRYFIQAEKQMLPGYKLMKMATPGYDTIEEYISHNFKSGTLGLDFELYPEANFKRLRDNIPSDIKIVDANLTKELWKDRPDLPKSKVFTHDVKYAGKTACDKLSDLRADMKDKGADVFVLSKLDDIAWLYNLRGADINCCPVFISYTIVTDDSATIYVDLDQVKDLKDFKDANFKDYREFFTDLEKINGKKVLVDTGYTNHKAYAILDSKNEIINRANPTDYRKAIKNKVELDNQKRVYVIDAVAITKFIKWAKENHTDEVTATKKLLEFRKESDEFFYDSFDTICAYGPNAAMMHYHATEADHAKIENHGFLLVDSGGQYLGGTTDITRTIAVGELTEEEIRDYTLTLKCHLALLNAVFLEGTSTIALDGITRINVWKYHMDYKCGTGHGVGHFLNVHEGPHGISPRAGRNVPMEPGMIVSNEPGVYKENKHGIRIENIMECVDDGKYPDGRFFKFESLSYIPFDLSAIDKDLLTKEEIETLNSYHKKTYELLAPHFDGEMLEFLKHETREI